MRNAMLCQSNIPFSPVVSLQQQQGEKLFSKFTGAWLLTGSPPTNPASADAVPTGAGWHNSARCFLLPIAGSSQLSKDCYKLSYVWVMELLGKEYRPTCSEQQLRQRYGGCCSLSNSLKPIALWDRRNIACSKGNCKFTLYYSFTYFQIERPSTLK